MINLTGSLAGVGANLPAGLRDIGTGPVTFGNESMDRLEYSATDLTAQVARLLTSDASGMIHNRLDFNSTFPPTLPHRDARRDSVPSGARSCRRPTFQPDLPRRARHSRDRHIHRQNERHAWLCVHRKAKALIDMPVTPPTQCDSLPSVLNVGLSRLRQVPPSLPKVVGVRSCQDRQAYFSAQPAKTRETLTRKKTQRQNERLAGVLPSFYACSIILLFFF